MNKKIDGQSLFMIGLAILCLVYLGLVWYGSDFFDKPKFIVESLSTTWSDDVAEQFTFHISDDCNDDNIEIIWYNPNNKI